MAYRLGETLDYDPFEDEDEGVIDSPLDFSIGEPLEIDPFEGQDPYVNEPRSSDLDEPDEGGHSLWDIPRMMGKGAAGMAKTASMMHSLMSPAEWSAKAAGLIGDVSQNEALQAFRDYSNKHGVSAHLQQYGETAEDYYDEKLSPAMKRSMRKTILASGEEEGFFGEGIKDPWKIGGMIAESIPSTLVSMGAGALITKGLIQTGFKFAPKIVQGVLGKMIKKYGINAVAGVVGGAVGEGGYSGMENANNAFEEMMDVPQEKLAKSRTYQEIYNSLPASLSDEKKHAYARKILSMATAGFIGSITAVTTGILGAPSGAFLGKLIGGEGGKSLWGNLIKGAITEGFFEELPQSGIERLVQNVSTKLLVDPNQKLGEGIAEAMAGGAITGFAMGGGMAGGGMMLGKSLEQARNILTDGADISAKDILLDEDQAAAIREKGEGKRFKGGESIEAEEEAGEFAEEELEKLAKKPKEVPSDRTGRKGEIPGKKPQREEPKPPPITRPGKKEVSPGGVLQKPKADEGIKAPVTDRREIVRPEEAERRAEPEREPPPWDKNFRAIYTNAQKMDEAKFLKSGKAVLAGKNKLGLVDLARRMGETIEADTDIDEALKTVHARIKAGMQPRKKASEMTEEELREASNTDYLTGLRNKQAFDLEDTRRAHVASIDLDSLKYINDNFGHQAGDAMLINFGNALKTITEADTYHVSGDEFIVQSDDESSLEELLSKRVVDHLNKNPLTVITPDGKRIQYEVQFSYGTAETVAKAEEKLHAHKEGREAEGKRAGRGEIPPGLPGYLAPGERTGAQREEVPAKEIAGGRRKAPMRTTPPDTDSATKIKKELAGVDTSPTEAQKDAGNYKKGHIKVMGFNVTVENPEGSYREGVSPEGKKWRTKMANTYGYFSRTEGKDGDEIDLFMGPDLETPVIQIVHQIDPKTKKPDEDKVMLGFSTPQEAKAAYFANYDKGWQGFGSMTQMLKVDFADWLDKQTKERAAKKKAKKLPSPKVTTGAVKRKPTEKPAGPILPTRPIEGAEGKKTRIITPGNPRGYNAYYTVVEAEDLLPSHNPRTFQKNPKYPEGIQERTYHTDTTEQGKVISNAQRLNPNIVLSDDPTPTNGPPIATPGGIVLGGNSRAMSLQRAYSSPKKANATKYRNALITQATKFGLTPKEIEARRQPVLVRTVYIETDDVQTLHRMATEFNKTLTQGVSQEAEIASMGKNISIETIEKIGLRMADRDLSLRELLGKKDGLQVLRWLIADDVVSASDENRFVNQKVMLLNEPGKVLIEKAIFGSIIDDPDLIDAAPKGLQNKIGRALPSLARIKARGDQWDITPEVKDALQLATQAQGADLSIREFLKQIPLFGDQKQYSQVAQVIGQHLVDNKMLAFVRRFRAFAADAMADVKKQTFLFEPKTFEQAFEDAFDFKVSEEQAPRVPPEPTRPAAPEEPTITTQGPPPKPTRPSEPELMSPAQYLDYVQAKYRKDQEDTGIDYTEKVKVEETGRVIERKIDAVAYLNDVEDEIAAYESLLNCMAGRSK